MKGALRLVRTRYIPLTGSRCAAGVCVVTASQYSLASTTGQTVAGIPPSATQECEGQARLGRAPAHTAARTVLAARLSPNPPARPQSNVGRTVRPVRCLGDRMDHVAVGHPARALLIPLALRLQASVELEHARVPVLPQVGSLIESFSGPRGKSVRAHVILGKVVVGDDTAAPGGVGRGRFDAAVAADRLALHAETALAAAVRPACHSCCQSTLSVDCESHVLT